MQRRFRWLVIVAAIATLAGCATAAGGLVGAGIGRASGDTTTGVLIGSGVGMMIDIMD
jgi:hypothetical protein